MRRGIENPDSFLLLVWWDTWKTIWSASAKAPPSPNGAPCWGRMFAAPPAVEHYAAPL